MSNQKTAQNNLLEQLIGKNTNENNPATAPKNEDTIVLQNNYKLKINPTKLKYFRNGDFNLLILIKEIGPANLISKFTDGYDILSRFLSAVLDKPYTSEQIKKANSEEYETRNTFDKTIENLIENELSVIDIENIITNVLKVNKIDIENFTVPQAKAE